MRYAARDYNNHSGSVSGIDLFDGEFSPSCKTFLVASHATTEVSEADYAILDVNDLFSFQKTLQAVPDARGSR